MISVGHREKSAVFVEECVCLTFLGSSDLFVWVYFRIPGEVAR